MEYELAFLRSLSWIESTGAQVGHSIHMELQEMGLDGPAQVVATDPHGKTQTLVSSTREEFPNGIPVFNFQVEDFHTYYVAAKAGNNALLVHNADCVSSLPWFNRSSRKAAKAIEDGASSVTVGSRDEASEIVWRMFSSQGFLNTTGRSGSDVRRLAGSKFGTYHWDEVLDGAGRVAGHAADNAHGALPHVQIHDEFGKIIRIFFN